MLEELLDECCGRKLRLTEDQICMNLKFIGCFNQRRREIDVKFNYQILALVLALVLAELDRIF